MTGNSALLEQASSDAYLSEESVKIADPTRKLLLVVWKKDEAILPANLLADRFQSLADTWRQECAYLSSVREMAIHPTYQQIVGMGKDALPFIFAELEREPDHWFWALRAITGDNPVLPEHQGDMATMAKDWLQWAKRRGVRW